MAVGNDITYEYGKVLKDDEETYRIMHEFIKARLIKSDIVLELDLDKGTHNGESLSNMRNELFDRLFMAMKEQDLDHFTFVFSGADIHELWGKHLSSIKFLNF